MAIAADVGTSLLVIGQRPAPAPRPRLLSKAFAERPSIQAIFDSGCRRSASDLGGVVTKGPEDWAVTHRRVLEDGWVKGGSEVGEAGLLRGFGDAEDAKVLTLETGHSPRGLLACLGLNNTNLNQAADLTVVGTPSIMSNEASSTPPTNA